MNLDVLEQFFFWWMIVNLGIYTLSALVVMAFPHLAINTQTRLMGVDEATVRKTVYNYLANFKIVTIVFSFAPWLALVIIS